MNTCSLYSRGLDAKLKDLNNVTYLVHLGIFKYSKEAEEYRANGKGPAYFTLSKRIFYTKESVLKWIKEISNEVSQEAS